MSCHVVGQTNLETALYAYIFEYFVTTSASTVIQHIRGRLPFGFSLPFFTQNNTLNVLRIAHSFFWVTKLVISELPTAMQNYVSHRNRTI